MDYYKILGVEKNATQDEIKAAYRKRAMETHPDRNPGDKQAEEQFKQVQKAYDILSDVFKKAQHDTTSARSSARPGGSPFSGSPFSGIWDSVFTTKSATQERGRNIQTTLDIELIDVLNGITRTITIPKRDRCAKCAGNGFTEYRACNVCHGSGKQAIKQSPFNMWMGCSACQGSGRAGTVGCLDCKGQGFVNSGSLNATVTIPPGVDTGHQMRVTGYGEPSKDLGGRNGDLVIIVVVKTHPLFKKHGVNLTYELPMGFSELCLGASLEIPTLTKPVIITVPSRTQDHTQLRLKGMGLPYFNGGKGDFIVVVKLIIPSKEIIESNKELFEKITDLEKNYLKAEREKL